MEVTPISDFTLNEKLSSSFRHCEEVVFPFPAVPGSVQKRYLVFDHSKNGKNLMTQGSLKMNPWPVMSAGLEADQGMGETSEMHEDTEEIDALLYSNSDSEYEDEETSTGHSPSAITEPEKQETVRRAEKVASSDSKTKRKRLPDQENDVLTDTACSSAPYKLRESGFDAESSCIRCKSQGKTNSSSTNKRSKKEKIQETIRILQSIIPVGKGIDAVFVLDEAIHYLTSLKLKAKSLGLTLK